MQGVALLPEACRLASAVPYKTSIVFSLQEVRPRGACTHGEPERLWSTL